MAPDLTVTIYGASNAHPDVELLCLASQMWKAAAFSAAAVAE